MQNACITQNNSREFLTLQQASDELGCTRRSLEKRIEDLEIDTFIQKLFTNLFTDSQHVLRVLCMSQRHPNTNNPREFLTLQQASDELGCTRRFLEKRIEDGELATFKPSKRLVRLPRKELNRWIESYTCRKVGGLS